MFLTVILPRSSSRNSSRSRTASLTDRLIRISPGRAFCSRRAATFTPSPRRSAPDTTTSPTLTPIRNAIRLSAGSAALWSAMPFWNAMTQRMAETALGNSISRLSPAVLATRPPCSARSGSINSVRCVASARSVASSSCAIIREYPATSAATIVVSLRSTFGSFCDGKFDSRTGNHTGILITVCTPERRILMSHPVSLVEFEGCARKTLWLPEYSALPSRLCGRDGASGSFALTTGGIAAAERIK